jgi:hypothetical protein
MSRWISESRTRVGVAVDSDGNLYVGSAHEQTIYRIDFADSTRTTFASVPVSGPMEFGPDGYLYVVTTSGLSRVSPGGVLESVVEITNLSDFDWAPDGRIYLLSAESGAPLRRQSHEQVTAVLQGQRIRVFDGFVYVTELSRARIVRFRIEGSTLGPLQVHFPRRHSTHGSRHRPCRRDLRVCLRARLHHEGGCRSRERRGHHWRSRTPLSATIRSAGISTRISEVHIHNSVMYVVQDVPAGTPGKVWRIFIDERNAPAHGRD